MHYKGNSIFAPRFALIRQSFTVGPPLASGGLNFCLIFQVGNSPKFFLPMQYFADSPKFYAANVSHYTVPYKLYFSWEVIFAIYQLFCLRKLFLWKKFLRIARILPCQVSWHAMTPCIFNVYLNIISYCGL